MPFTVSAVSFLAFLASARALTVTSPAEDAEIDLTQDTTIEWTSVSSDPDSFNIVLTNQNVNPPVEIPIAADVQASEGSYVLSDFRGAAPGGSFQINLESSTKKNQGILAQSKKFDVTEPGTPITAEDSEDKSSDKDDNSEDAEAEDPNTDNPDTDDSVAASESADAAEATMTDDAGDAEATVTETAVTDATVTDATVTDATVTDTDTMTMTDSADSSDSTDDAENTDSESDSESATDSSAAATETDNGNDSDSGASSLKGFAGAGFLVMVVALFA